MGASAIGLSHVAIQFPVYEYFKAWLAARRQRERGEASTTDRLSTVDLIVASSGSKVIGHRPARLPAYQLAVCASVATVTPAHAALPPLDFGDPSVFHCGNVILSQMCCFWCVVSGVQCWCDVLLVSRCCCRQWLVGCLVGVLLLVLSDDDGITVGQ